MSSDVNTKLEAFLDEKIRPVLRQHEGDIAVVNLSPSTVTFQLLGMCSGCPGAMATTGEFIREEVTGAFPEITSVVFNGVSDDLIAQAKAMLQHSYRR